MAYGIKQTVNHTLTSDPEPYAGEDADGEQEIDDKDESSVGPKPDSKKRRVSGKK
jgi:hypothetical protein